MSLLKRWCRNGYLETAQLFDSPFTEVSTYGLLGVFNQDQATEAVSLLQRVNQYAEAVLGRNKL